jgi:hypothetical protein
MIRLKLPDVTLCAAASVNVEATVSALNRCLDQIDFGNCFLFTHVEVGTRCERSRIKRIDIPRLTSAEAYSHFLLRDLAQHIETTHCLVVQWDGFILDAGRWTDEFLSCDYIGAPWPQFEDGHEIGNGGFSLRSRRLLEACKDPAFEVGHPEDVAIARENRGLLERRYGLQFADRELASRFSFERTIPERPTFGFHGIFNLVKVVGPDEFWRIYRTLDERSTVAADYWRLMRQLGWTPTAWRRKLRLTLDRVNL